MRNPQRFGWDPRNGNLFLADIGQDIVEELSMVPMGGNLGWNKWEGSFGFISRQAVDLNKRRSDPDGDLSGRRVRPARSAAADAVGRDRRHVYRSNAIPQLTNLLLFGDFPSGEIFYLQADKLPSGGQDGIRRILLNDGGEAKTFLKVIQEKNAQAGEEADDARGSAVRRGTGCPGAAA